MTSARTILLGVLSRAPTRKTSKNGNPYVFATIREGNGDGARWWKVFVFGETAIEAIEQLREGEAVAVSGAFEAKIYAAEGKEPRVDLSMTVDAVLSAKAKPRERKAKPPRTTPAKISGGSTLPHVRGGDLDDDLPF
jgi:single-stranded DNA-binding protein